MQVTPPAGQSAVTDHALLANTPNVYATAAVHALLAAESVEIEMIEVDVGNPEAPRIPDTHAILLKAELINRATILSNLSVAEAIDDWRRMQK